ncbi:LuxR C-terminal-related transcriptional regulator [Streptomyces sp. NPDC048142]|uniref:LuxR C-terminal-related transcriptional regulator n=1 Tax=Streptomyces sp. NPDC048142 TaxID=3365501 RepID=UPI00371EECFB
MCAQGLARYRYAVIKGCMPLAQAPGCLLRLGLVTPPPDDPRLLVPVAPDVALDELLQPLEEDIRRGRQRVQRTRSDFSSVQAMYRAAVREARSSVARIDGEGVVMPTLEKAVRSCRSELATIQPLGERNAFDLEDPRLVPRGVTHRTLYPHAAQTNAQLLRHIARVEEAGGYVRTVDQVIGRLLLCDRSSAYLVHSDGSPHAGAVEITHPGIVAFLVCVFEDAWQRGTPVSAPVVRARESVIVDEVERAVMRLLVSGHTDDAIARRLGVSRRTVAGHVSRISQQLGSRSRAQLGYLIARAEATHDGAEDLAVP